MMITNVMLMMTKRVRVAEHGAVDGVAKGANDNCDGDACSLQRMDTDDFTVPLAILAEESERRPCLKNRRRR